ncbi:dihydrodipicolinate synthase family protein, partial [Vibrio kyushuensis]|uniref:dihydrodipicolinate synthase family protein n=1 Tax=Vibrio kyushuensis TaxID=2910249 RepID=UPI003D0DDBE3
MLSQQKYDLVMDGAFIPAIPLALNEDLSFNEQRQRALVRYYLDAGVDGIAAAVHTTQFEIRQHKETYERFMVLVLEEIDAFESRTGKQILRVAGISGELEQAKREADYIQTLGYDVGLLSVSAYSNDTPLDVLVDYYRAVSEITPVFGFYMQTSVGGRELPYEFWEQVLQNERVVGVKAAPFDRYRTIEVARACANTAAKRKVPVALYTGNDDSIVTDLLTTYTFNVEGEEVKVPVRGGLLGHWSVWAKTAVDLFQDIKEQRQGSTVSQEMLTRAVEVTDANSAFFDVLGNFDGCIAGIHEVLRKQGFFEGIYCYPGNGDLSPGQQTEIERVYESYPHLHDDEFVSTHI